MNALIYNLIVRDANSRNYWENVRKLARQRGIEDYVVLYKSHKVMVADLSQATLDETAWKLYSEIPQILQEHESRIADTEIPRLVIAPTCESERIRKKLSKIELRRGSDNYRIVVVNGDGSDIVKPSQPVEPAIRESTLRELVPLDESFLKIYRAIKGPELARKYLEFAFRKD